ncbi:hypothetical protein HK102_009902, partial [Quaeritorhiza haematococci]
MTPTIETQIQDVFGILKTLQKRLKTPKNLLNRRKALRQVVSDLENEVAQLQCELANRKSDLTNSKNDLAKVEDEILKIQNDLEHDLAKVGTLVVHGAAAAGSNALWRVPEVIGIIASYCDPRVLASLGLVCKAWYRIARPLLWRHVRIENSTDIGKCIDHRHWIVTVECPFEPWLLPFLSLLPNLRELFLHNVKILGDALAALCDLNIKVLKLDSSGTFWNFRWDPSVDRVRARSFLHRLVSIDFGLGMSRWDDTTIVSLDFGLGMPRDDNTKMTIIEDVMHEGLRKIDFGLLSDFGFNLPIDYLSAAHHLTVICVSTKIPESFFRTIADHCPHLAMRAFRCLDLRRDDFAKPDWWKAL